MCHYFSASDTSGTSFVRLVHLAQLWCIWVHLSDCGDLLEYALNLFGF
ncbi:hypothetical protein KSS87_021695 [Heliosperma pusillum]|nr:hypothetical protein KSS87_021695 [Heliosperma pusillum]